MSYYGHDNNKYKNVIIKKRQDTVDRIDKSYPFSHQPR